MTIQDPPRATGTDIWDGVCVLGVGLLFAGLWVALSLGIALTVVGALVLALGVAGAHRGAAPASRNRDLED